MVSGPSALMGNKQALDFIRQHEDEDPYALSLKYREVHGIPIAVISRQVESRQKAQIKLPEWYDTAGVIFPDPLNLQQSSSEATARYKNHLLPGQQIVDLTGGSGVDSYYITHQKEGIFVEPEEGLCRLAAYNFKLLGRNISIKNTDAESFLTNMPSGAQVYIDPSRRDATKRKTVLFTDCSPNVIDLLPRLLEKSERILIKGSPMLDIRQAISSLNYQVLEIHVLEWMGECREVLFLLTREKVKEPIIYVVNLDNGQSIQFTHAEEQATEITYGPVSHWLYEPSPAMMKSGGFKTLARTFGLSKLHVNTQLYTSSEPVKDFPGRIFEVIDYRPFSMKKLKQLSEGGQANITTRNFPESVASLRKKSRIRDGGDVYLFVYTGPANKRMVCKVRKPDF